MGTIGCPKPATFRDRKVIDYVLTKRDGICMIGLCRPGAYGACSAGLDPHHITNKGAGGSDHPHNLIALCRRHHNLAQSKEIPAEELRAILAERFGY